jgi:hypothetical protein
MEMTENSQKYVIKAESFGAVGTLWAGTPSSISPFQYGKIQAPGNAEKLSLAQAGICDATGQILPAVRPILDVLGTATGFTRMYLSGGMAPTECIVYFAPGRVPVSLFNAEGNMQIGFPAAVPQFVEMAAQGIGTSVYRAVPFSATLALDESVVLAAMIDIQRKQNLKSLADEQSSSASDCDIPVLWKNISQKGDNTQWLGNVLMELLSLEGISSEDRVRTAAESLVQKGYALKQGSSYRLSEILLTLAGRMLIFDNALILTSGYLSAGGSLSIAGFTCLQAGIHDLLIIDAAADSVTFQTVSSAGVLDNVQTWFSDVQKLETLDAGQAGATVSQTRKFCPQCGAAFQPGRKFCGGCGAKL